MRDRVGLAMAAVSRELHGIWPDGTAVRQVSNPDVVARMLRLLDPQPGDRVLEVGTGSAYSTTLLSILVGPSGSVVSLDVDAELVERARRLLHDAGATNVRVVRRDGRLGYARAAAFDALVAWASSERELPQAWVDQVREAGTIVAPFADGRIRKLCLQPGGRLSEEAAFDGGFVPLTARPFRPWEDTGQA